MPKDLFSKQSKNYSKFRPKYPKDLYDFLYYLLKESNIPLNIAWDVGTGNGQVAHELAKKFQLVYASDISYNQIENAIKKDNIIYKIESAENTSLPNQCIDLITVAQALHWFQCEDFFQEVKRVAHYPTLFAVWFYGILKTEKNIFNIFYHLYKEILGNYWEPERIHIETNYERIHFPFKNLRRCEFNLKLQWTKEEFLGYISSWSSYQHYIDLNSIDPLIDFKKEIDKYWKDEELKELLFPIHFIYSIID